MKKYFPLILLCIAVFSELSAQSTSRTKINFGADWEFKREESASSWEKITIPHTAKVEPLVVKNQFQGTFFYQKKFRVADAKDQKNFLYFEGVMQETEVFVNDKKVLQHDGGYLPFTIDISDFVIPNKEITIQLKVRNTDNPLVPPGKPLKDLDFNYYGGIYRNVFLITTSKLHITDAVHANKKASGGVFASFDKINKTEASGTIKVHLKNEFADHKKASLLFTLTDKEGQEQEFKSAEFNINANEEKELLQNIAIKNPKLWSINSPNLYDLKVSIVSNKKTIDVYHERIGIRKSEIKADGYYLNDEKLFISGTNRHQEYPYLGYAISDEAQYRDAVKIKNAGFDFVRLSHYPQAEAFLNACDELGILVMNSLPGWQFFGSQTFQENAYQNIRDMARRDRNHPSIIFWEVSLNESEMSADFMQKAPAILKEELPFQNSLTAAWMDNPNYDIFIPARQHGKAPDYWSKYSNNGRKIFIAEYGDWEYYAQNAGFNQTEFANLKEEERTSRQLRAFGEKRLLQQAYNFQEAANSNRKGPETIGEANWLMFDYNRGYSDDLESSGISDIFRIPKFAYYFYQSQRDANVILDKKLASGPMVSIATFWTENSPLDITVYSNCDEVALYLNNNLIAKQKPTVNHNSDLLKHAPFTFKTGQFISGVLKAEGFINGKKVASSEVKSPGKTSKIVLNYDLSSVGINKETPDVIFVYAKITDQNGTVIPTATNEVTFTLEGENAKLIGENPVKAEAGIATIILRTDSFKKTLKIKATASNLAADTIAIK